MSEKFTDEQILDALQRCEKEKFEECEKCAYCGTCRGGGYTQIFTDALDLINRQKEEIERERHLNDKRRMDYEDIRAEAVKECLEKVAQAICDNTYPDFNKDGKPVNVWKAREGYDAIDALAKKIIEEVTT